jgi:predicted DNA-binding transcriptional regulator AlpA
MARSEPPAVRKSSEFQTAPELEDQTGIPASTFSYWANMDPPQGPPSFKLGRRRLWRRTAVLAWIAEQEMAGTGVS